MAEPVALHVYWVEFVSRHGPDAVGFGVAFETPLSDAAAVAGRLAADGVVSGAKLDLAPDGQGGRMIRGRSGFAFGAAGLVSIQDIRGRLWEPEA